jgi:hypothetical protein
LIVFFWFQIFIKEENYCSKNDDEKNERKNWKLYLKFGKNKKKKIFHSIILLLLRFYYCNFSKEKEMTKDC